MAKVKKFEEIESWKKARSLTKQVYEATLTGPFARDFGLRDQIRRAAVSILSNIAEGFERGGDKEFLQFLSIAKGSSGELRAQLYVALDQRYISNERFEQLSAEATKVSQLIAGFMRYLKQSELRGNKLK
jgi:four helix bundle protein